MNWIKQGRLHLKETRWGYWYHLYHSFYQSGRLIVISIKSILHGIFPWIFTASATLGIYRIYKEIRSMHQVNRMFLEEDNIKKS